MTMTYRGYSGDTSDTKILRASLSMELMQSSLLTHDDLLDEAILRRGGLTPHEWLKDWYIRNVTNDEVIGKRFGENMAILFGRSLQFLWYPMLA